MAARSRNAFDAAGGQRKSSPAHVLGWVSPSASRPTPTLRLGWLSSLLAQQHSLPAFETPRENSLRWRRSEQRGFARRCYQGTRCTQLGGVVGRHRQNPRRGGSAIWFTTAMGPL